MGQAVLELRDVRKRFGDREALRGVTVSVGEGEFLGLVGPNGAGKTTLIRVSLGLLRRDSGDVRLFGRDPFLDPTARESVGVIFERPSLPATMPVIELLRRAARIYGVPESDVREAVKLAGLEGHESRPFGQLSAGLKQRAAIAHALIASPKFLVTDEPTSNLDPVERASVLETLSRLKKEKGVTILLSSHVLSEVLRVVDRIVVIKQGSVVAQGAPDEVIGSIKVARVRAPDPQALAKALSERGLSAEARVQEVTVRLRGPDDERALLLALADAVGSGIRYYGIDLVEPGLEELLREVS
ncbi:ABC transporter ATP-binding protein [Acidilobus sp.]|uniref:ABC transporter ATP-binding protein n=1 Tax=Acidilobus sp. TaxID=1872109 RepID=UPI003D042C2F